MHVHPAALSPLRGVVLVLAGAVLWGTSGTSQALGPEAASPLAVGTTRLVLGGALLVVWALAAARRATPVGSAVPPPTHGRGRAGLRSVAARVRSLMRGRVVAGLLGAVGVAGYQMSFFAAVDIAGVALGTAVAIGSSPVFTGLIQWAIGGPPPGRRWWLATALGAAGVGVLAGPSSLVLPGVLLALTAGAAYAIYAVAAKRLLDTGLSSSTAMAVVFGVGGLLLVPVLPALDLSWLATNQGVGMLAWLAVGTILLAYLLFGAGLRVVSAATAATLSLVEPLTAALLGVVALGERLSASAMLGAGLVLAGLLVLGTARRRPIPAPS